MRRIFQIIAVLVLVWSLTACGATPKQSLVDAYNKSKDMTSYDLHVKMNLGIDVPADKLGDPQAAQVAAMLKNAELQIDGVYQKEPFQAEMTLQINIKGDMNVGINAPMVLTKEKAWIKVPNVPFIPIPPSMVGKFVEVDLKEMQKTSGSEALDSEKGQQFVNELMGILAKNFDEKTYFKTVAKKDVTLPSGVEVNELVQLQVNQSNFEDAVKVSVDKVIPQVFDLLTDPKYSGMFASQKADIEKAKEQFNKEKPAPDKVISDMNEHVGINNLTLLTGINKKDFIVYQSFKAEVDVKDKGAAGKVTMNVESWYDKINEKAEFKIGIPSGDQVITQDAMKNMF